MIDMSSLYEHDDYPAALTHFETHQRWSIFQNVHLKVTKNRCPICECRLDGSVSRPSKKGTLVQAPTIDHFRPKDKNLYPFLAYVHHNYILMCSDCNTAYKDNLFPLYNNADRAISVDTLATEQPLIVNPIKDELLPLFTVVLRYTPSGKKVLELQAKASAGYLYEQATETIKVFSLGDCEVNVHHNQHVRNGRIELLNDHFKKFSVFVKALAKGDKETAFAEYQKYQLDSYGFTQFIIKTQFIDLT